MPTHDEADGWSHYETLDSDLLDAILCAGVQTLIDQPDDGAPKIWARLSDISRAHLARRHGINANVIERVLRRAAPRGCKDFDDFRQLSATILAQSYRP